LEPYRLTLSQASSMIHEGTLTPTALAESLLDRITNLEPILQAWVTVDDEKVMSASEELTKEAVEGKFRGLLHGIPIGVKDIFYTKGTRTTMGSPIFQDFTPDYDAKVVSQLKASGAMILGKTETTEFALHDPAPTRNPWNTLHTPGGSSSGSASAVSSGMAPLALGTQTGGSIIRPASYCGIVGFKGTYDLLSRSGVFPLSWSLDHVGFMTRTVSDAIITLKALRPDLKPADISNTPRIGLLSGYFMENAGGEVWPGFERVVGTLWGEGATFTDVKLPKSFSLVHDVHKVIMSVETAAVHEDIFRDKNEKYGEYIHGFISSGLMVPATAYLRAQRLRDLIIRDLIGLLKDYDCLACPSTKDTAPLGLESTGSPAYNVPWSLSGFPSVTIPSGLSKEGMPLGLQLIGKPYDDMKLLRVANWCQKYIKFPATPKDPINPNK
jgi:aspartyl-tRNA(Asn)/glutamyl-tRNA(Gln) amidotransferase subunit A